MSENDRTVTASTKLSPAVADFLDSEAERRGMARDELLRGLVDHLRTATEAGLTCPHCKNDLLIDL